MLWAVVTGLSGLGPPDRVARGRGGEGAGQRHSPGSGDLFVGREPETAALSQMFADQGVRLITLTGPPGIGKTRLALAVAAAAAERSGGQVTLVDLAPIRNPAAVMPELAQALDIGAHGTVDLTDWPAAIGEDRLVVLDNFEHLLAAAPELGHVLGACPWLRVLATSRELLRLAAEREFPVPPLPIPSPGEVTSLGSLAANPSIALLIDRARRANPGFTLTARNAQALVSACIQLEGLPLALELAGARLKALSPDELAFRLAHRMDLLVSRTRDVPPRQRALRSAVAWSYDLLTPGERSLFRRLSVFVGGWALADAGSVCAGVCDDVLAVIESLLDKSLVRRVTRDDQTTGFSMLESLREFAAEQLAVHGEAEEARAAHAARYTDLAIRLEMSLGVPEEREMWLGIGHHQANLRAALEHCLASGERDRALALATALGWYCYTRAGLGSDQAVIDETLSAVTGPGGAAGGTAAGDSAVRGALVAAGIMAWGRGQLDRADALLQRALACSGEVHDVRRATVACSFLGHVARARGRYGESARWHHQSALGFQRLGNAQGVAWSRHDLGLLARDQGDLDRAAALFRESLRAFRDLDYPWAVAWSAWGLGATLCDQDRAADARPLIGEALEIYRDQGDHRGVAQCLEALARVACDQASYEASARLIGAAAMQRARLATPLADADSARISALEDTLRRKLGPEAAERLRQDGRAMPVEQAVELGTAVASGLAPGDPDRGGQRLLTRRERQVAALVASGRTNRQIGKTLGISEKTAEVHLHRVMGKLDARSRAEVAAWAASHDLHQRGR